MLELWFSNHLVPMALSGRQVLFQIRCWASHPPCSSRKLSLLSHFPLPLPTPSPLPAQVLDIAKGSRSAAGVPPAHIYSGRSVFPLTWSQPRGWD